METVLLNQGSKEKELDKQNEETILLNQENGDEETVLLGSAVKSQNHTTFVKLVREKNGQIILINKSRFKIGRKKEIVDFCIQEDKTISRMHAEIIVDEEHVYVMDNNSKNHVYINGIKIDSNVKMHIIDGDILRLATENFRVVITKE